MSSRRHFLACSMIALGLGLAGSAWAADAQVEKKRADIRKGVSETLQEFYKADAKLKGEVQKAAGYAVFKTYGGSLIVGGAGGEGLVRDNKSGKETFMSIAQASAGLQIGVSRTRYLFIFKDAAATQRFIDSGWEAGASASAGAGAGKEKINAGAGAGEFTGGKVYTLTDAGVQAGGAVAGTKVWKNDEIN